MSFITIGNVTVRKDTITSIKLDEWPSRSSHKDVIEICTKDGKPLEASFDSKDEAQKAYEKAKKELIPNENKD